MGGGKRAEQLSFEFGLYIHEPNIPGLNVAVGSGMAWKRCNGLPNDRDS